MCRKAISAGLLSNLFANTRFRCFLFLVNYSRLKPDVAMKALPILVDVCSHSIIVRCSVEVHFLTTE